MAFPAVRRPARATLTALLHRPIRLSPSPLLARWRSSLQLRVVGGTLLLSSLVVVLLGVVLLDQISNGLLAAKRRAAVAESSSGLRFATSLLSGIDGSDSEALKKAVTQLAASLSSRGSPAGSYDVVILSPFDAREPVATGEVEPSSVPAALRRLVTGGGQQAYAYTTLQGSEGVLGPGLVVGAPLSTGGGSFELYYLFPLEPEVDTVHLVRRTLLFGGLGLLLLLGLLSVFVTRQVVTPVRLAARTAERLATGRLQERMAVRGEDDLARLATSFNGMADSLERQIGQLEELSRLQRRFTSDVSHELRTPLTTVRMAADLLFNAREDFPPHVARSAELLSNQLDRFEALLGDLLEISRYDARAAVLEPEATDLRHLVRRVAADVAPIAVREGIDLRLRLPAEPVIAEVDPRRVERILRNLLGNAVEHGEGAPVDVTLAGDDAAVAVSVRDYGVGLRPGEAAFVFNRFWRADPSRARQTGGTGLGLSISLEDARLHGGWLQAWGEPGRGAQFRLTLPARAGGVLASSPLPLEPAEGDGALGLLAGRPGG